MHITCSHAHSITGPSPASLCCQSDASEQNYYGPMSFITSYRGQARLITVCAGEPQAQYEVAAAQQPAGSIKGPDGFHTNNNVTSTFLQPVLWKSCNPPSVWMSVQIKHA